MKRKITDCKTDRGMTGILNAKGKMSEELWQNARLTMGELRDMMRETGISWSKIEQEIQRGSLPPTGIVRKITHPDPYSTGTGRSLQGLPRNI